MPNLKIYVDATHGNEALDAVRRTLLPLRKMLCADLDVDVGACQFAVLSVYGLADQPQVNAEIFIMPRPDRTRARITGICQAIQEMLAEATRLPVAVRSNMLDAETYIALKGPVLPALS
jgi:hypothetical protein